MSADLYITPTRRALLQDVADGVIERHDAHDYDATGVRVTARMAELVRAGLAWRTYLNDEWRLTADGESALASPVPTRWPLTPKAGTS